MRLSRMQRTLEMGEFTFDQYVGIHQRGHNVLLDLEEPVAGTMKVSDFIAKITDPKLETAKMLLMRIKPC